MSVISVIDEQPLTLSKQSSRELRGMVAQVRGPGGAPDRRRAGVPGDGPRHGAALPLRRPRQRQRVPAQLLSRRELVVVGLRRRRVPRGKEHQRCPARGAGR